MKSVWVADFETTTKAEDCRVWSWGLCPVKQDPVIDDVEMGLDITSFMEFIEDRMDIVYFHNLKFDGTFILYWLLSNGWCWTEELHHHSFTTLISKDSKFYSIEIMWRSGEITVIKDSLKKLPMPVARIAKSFHLPMSKGVIDYDAERPVGYIPTEEELEYQANDVMIVAAALWQQLEEGMTSLTVGADSLNEFKRIMGRAEFDRVFPVVDEDTDFNIRKAYRGGWCKPGDRFQKEIVGPVKVFDVNSLYPSVMYDSLMPYGIPIPFDGIPNPPKDFPLWIASATFTAKLKPDHLPTIQLKNHSVFIPTEYLTEIEEPTSISFTSIDWELWNEQYDIDVYSWDGGYYFAGSRDFFKPYIDKWMAVKKQAVGGLREIAKLHLNSLYGKFATNPDVTLRRPELEDGRVKLKIMDPDYRDPVYTAMGCFITAYARAVTIRAAQQNYDVFAYADTDSLHLVTDKTPDLNIDPVELGAWKHEYDADYALFWRPKAYVERRVVENESVYEVHIAGLPRSVTEDVRFCDIYEGAVFGGKKIPKNVVGGVVLEDVEFCFRG